MALTCLYVWWNFSVTVKQIRPDALPDASNSVTVGCHGTWMTACYLNHSAVGAGSMF